MACNSAETEQAGVTEPFQNDVALTEPEQEEQWARENFDLQRVGSLLERSSDPGEFESYLNADDGLNNLDLNGDGYVDYISVSEFDDRYDNERGLTLYTRFGPDQIQEIANIVFYREDQNYPGARVLLTGNEQIYGDDRYYETNWIDRSLAIVSTLFSNRDTYYQSPYYYDNYPDEYDMYQVVETPVYRSRIERSYPEPVFIRTSSPSFNQVRIKSPYKDKRIEKIYAKLAKPTREQTEFRKNNPNRPQFVKFDRERRGKRDDSARPDRQIGDDRRSDRGNPAGRDEKREDRAPEAKPDDKRDRGAERGKGRQKNPGRADKPDRGQGKPDKGGGKGPGKKKD